MANLPPLGVNPDDAGRPPARASIFGGRLGDLWLVSAARSGFGRTERAGVILTATGSLVITWGITSALGFVYWWAVVRTYSPTVVGLASAGISAMLLLGRLTITGLGTSLAGVLPHHFGSRTGLVAASLAVAAGAGAVLGLVFAVGAAFLSQEWRPLFGDPLVTGLFAIGVSLTATGVVLDQALVSLDLAALQLLRNAIFALGKLVVIVLAASALGDLAGIIVGSWIAGEMLALASLVVVFRRRGMWTLPVAFEWRTVAGLGRNALGHNALTVARQAPALVMPILVTVVLSANANAAFYVALILATAPQVVASAATFTLYAVGSRSPDALRHQLRLTFVTSIGTVGVGLAALLLLGGWILSLFGPTYRAEAGASLALLAVLSVPLVVKDHWIAIERISQGVYRASLILALGGLLEIVAAYIGAVNGGLVGLTTGWLLVTGLEAVFMLPKVYGALRGSDTQLFGVGRREDPDVPLLDSTAPIAILDPGAASNFVSPLLATAAEQPVRISVFIPVWNDTAWIEGAIESVLAQTHRDFELVIGDNASTEDVLGLVERYDDPRIRYHRFETHTDLIQNWNRTMWLCRYEWIQGLAADDRLRPNCLERIADRVALVQPIVPRLAMVITGCRRLDPDGRSADLVWYGTKPRLPVVDRVYNPAEWFDLCTRDGQPPWNNGSVAIARSVVEEQGGLMRPEIGLSADFEMAMRLGAYGHVAYIDEPLLDFMVRSGSDGPMRLVMNRESGAPETVVEVALRAALHAHQEARSVTKQERTAVAAAIARSHLQRAGQHRVLPNGLGRPGAIQDVLRAIRISPRTALAPSRLGYAVAAVVMPVRLLDLARDWVARRRHPST